MEITFVKTKMGDEFIPIDECFLEQNPRVDEQYRRRFVDLRDHVEQHGGIGAKTRDERDPARKKILDHDAQKFRRFQSRQIRIKPRGFFRKRQGWQPHSRP